MKRTGDVLSVLATLLLLLATGCGGCVGCAKREVQPAGAAPESESAPQAPEPSPAAAPPPPADAAEQREEEKGRGSGTPGVGTAERMVVMPDGTQKSLEDAGDAQRGLVGDLDRSLRLGAVDCPTASQHRGAICEIAKRICALVEGDPNQASTPDTNALCADSKERCSAAEKRYGQACQD